MNDKEKQIEEMKDIVHNLWDKLNQDAITTDDIVDAFYNVGYRKIPKDSIVLTKEQIEHPTDDKVIEFFVKHNEKVRKITVEEILKKIDKELYDISRLYLECVAKNSKDDDAINNYGVMTLAHNIVVNVAKEYGVEIKD